MLTIEALKSRFSEHFSSFESVGDNVGRFIRSSEGHPFAVYYVDVSERIPGSMEELDAYQDRVIAPRYFQGPKSLQWSHYLFFVASTFVPGETKELVERDRKYARKFIVSEPELSSALTPPRFQIAEGVIDASVLSTWTEMLAESNLDHAVFNNDSLPQRIKRIEAEFGHKGLGNPSPVVIRHKESPPFISSLELLKYRPCPRQRSFDFGTVTLVTGANGSGKTSLLEAIELLYCGVNKRDQKSRAPYNIRATFRDGQTENASIGKPTPSELRDRNLAWYGQTDIRTNTLFQSFSRYNFLDTDAAVAIADSKNDFEEDLSKLLVGPEASKTWREIERTNGELEKTLKELSAVEQQVQRELVSVEKQLSAAAAVPKESDALLKTLSEKLSDAAFPILADELVGRIPSLISVFATIEPIIEQAIPCDWTGSPVTIQTLRQFDATTEQFLVDAEAAILDCQSSAKRLKASREAEDRLVKKDAEISEFAIYLDHKFVENHGRLANSQASLRDVQGRLAGRAFDPTDLASIADVTTPLGQYRSQKKDASERSQADAISAQSRLTEFTKLRDQVASLSQQLRDIASQILSQAEQKDVCPLCHQEYGNGELTSRIHQDVDSRIESESLTLRESLRHAKSMVAASKHELAVADWLLKVAAQIGLTDAAQVSSIVAKVLEFYQQEVAASEEVHEAKASCDSLFALGLTRDRYEKLATSILGESVSSLPIDLAIGDVRAKLTEERRLASTLKAGCEQDLSDKLRHAGNLLGVDKPTLEECQMITSKRKERRDLVRSLLKQVDSNDARTMIKDDQPLAELLTSIKLIRNLLTNIQTALTNEQQAIVMASESTKRKREISAQLEGLQPRIKRLREAEEVFRSILERHSLASAMEDALQQNKAVIEEIFRRIHSPAEFTGLMDMTTLRRKDGQEAKLHQISTGQRAAYALSLFLAQNAQLRSAPQLMLIDDPIAHVDDLNSLSFLDYLREVALTGERQIVFATANEKLASLFQRKFEFLGTEQFKRHDISR